jgi:ABC-type bacteriocin/lantibiotic exporter with double-glycine peptidase domain
VPAKPPFFPQQKKNTCVCAALRMVLAYHGKVIPEYQVAQACGTTHRGTIPEGAVRAARHFEFGNTSIVRLTLGGLRRKVDAGLLPITYIDRRNAPWAHAVIVYEITGERDEDLVRYIDPALEDPGEAEMLVAEFKTYWRNAGMVAILVRK